MSETSRRRLIALCSVTLVINVAALLAGFGGWPPVGAGCSLVALVMALARPAVFGRDDHRPVDGLGEDTEAGGADG